MVTGVVPHVGGPILPPCAPLVLVGGAPAARLADFATCTGPPDVISKGASTVLINGLPAARLTDLTVHGGLITAPGAPAVLIGDPAFSVPPVFTITGPPDFQNNVIRDLYYLSTLPSGQQLLNRLQAAGQPITIQPFAGANSNCAPNSTLAALAGIPTGSVVGYNPNIHTQVYGYDAAGNRIAMPPQVVLGHELSHALANSEGNHHFFQDPSPPPSEPNMQEEEAQAIGVGSHTGQTPSENSLRADAGLPRRADHHGELTSARPGGPPQTNLRPGGP
jgi:uncharacterized Zn-binding protein involved in type VI secretion